MLTRPDISDDAIVAVARDSFGLRPIETVFLPIGADANSAVYRVTAAENALYLLKLRSGSFDEAAIAVPAFLRSRGIGRVMAPIATATNRLWIEADGFHWILHPFFEGKNGFERPLSRVQWIALGETMSAVHGEVLPASLAPCVAREDYSPRDRASVRTLDRQVEERSFDDPIAAHLAALWTSKRSEIRIFVERAERLASEMRQRPIEFVVCHSDLHAGNILGAGDDLVIVDWDNPILAPKERDLMFVGAGVGGAWNLAREAEWFYAGYGPVAIDPVAIAYYRYERIVADFAAYGERILGSSGSPEDREDGLRKVANQFLPGNVVEIAHRTYSELPRPL